MANDNNEVQKFLGVGCMTVAIIGAMVLLALPLWPIFILMIPAAILGYYLGWFKINK